MRLHPRTPTRAKVAACISYSTYKNITDTKLSKLTLKLDNMARKGSLQEIADQTGLMTSQQVAPALANGVVWLTLPSLNRAVFRQLLPAVGGCSGILDQCRDFSRLLVESLPCTST